MYTLGFLSARHSSSAISRFTALAKITYARLTYYIIRSFRAAAGQGHPVGPKKPHNTLRIYLNDERVRI